ncbi:carbonic anhydrase [Hirschia baltica]|uniref:Carbonic anhydrase n=1 Tax=Hirschia baltica (strain ATCC 49814 / DSM 5838 / IFAM 1418) TaxID=582402 RepID=C6XQK9_HIRBI|nr:carbonic anhydrase family protein [Hirschia baltica]ACT58615.1 Carbonate dehydratase [Hirschia baltica ATCC 49814]
MHKRLFTFALLATSMFGLAANAFAPPKNNGGHNEHSQAQTFHQTNGHTNTKSHENIHWAYSGPRGPAHWGEKDPANATCKTGTQQSPIDMQHTISAFANAPQIDWTPIKNGEVINNGHTLQLNVHDAGGLVQNGKTYKLIQFHFHTPSEHTIHGRHFPMEAHFVHKAEDGSLAVVGVMFAEGANNTQLDPLWWSAPSSPGSASVAFNLDIEDLLPTNRAAFRYQGSLTTPPCSEIVDWTVLQTPLNVSKTQIAAFRALFGDNARPTQPLYRRYVLETP